MGYFRKLILFFVITLVILEAIAWFWFLPSFNNTPGAAAWGAGIVSAFLFVVIVPVASFLLTVLYGGILGLLKTLKNNNPDAIVPAGQTNWFKLFGTITILTAVVTFFAAVFILPAQLGGAQHLDKALAIALGLLATLNLIIALIYDGKNKNHKAQTIGSILASAVLLFIIFV